MTSHRQVNVTIWRMLAVAGICLASTVGCGGGGGGGGGGGAASPPASAPAPVAPVPAINVTAISVFAGVVPLGSGPLLGSVDGTGPEARFSVTAGIGADASGNLYVADYANHTVRKISASGRVSTLAGLSATEGQLDGRGAAARFMWPNHVGVTPNGTTYVLDKGLSVQFPLLRRISPDGVVSTISPPRDPANVWADGRPSEEEIKEVAVDTKGNYYLSSLAWLAGTCRRPDPAQFCSGDFRWAVRKISSSGVSTTLLTLDNVQRDIPQYRNTNSLGTTGIVVDNAGNLYISDPSSGVILKTTPSGTVSIFAGTYRTSGTADGVVGTGTFISAEALAIDAKGNLYVADGSDSYTRTQHQTIRKITPAGVMSTLAGAKGVQLEVGALPGNLSPVERMVVASDGNLYVTMGGGVVRIALP